MTQEEYKSLKELLLKDLCARVPYGVKCCIYNFGEDTVRIKEDILWSVQGDNILTLKSYVEKGEAYMYHQIKPYLFPLSSMTEEQERELLDLTGYKSECTAYCGFDSMGYYIKNVGEFEYEEGEHSFIFYPDYIGLDWFNKNHFDYRGLIEKGLAIDATGLNIYE